MAPPIRDARNMLDLIAIERSVMRDRVYLAVREMMIERHPELDSLDHDWNYGRSENGDSFGREWLNPFYISVSHDHDATLDLYALCDLGAIGYNCTEQDQVLYMVEMLEQGLKRPVKKENRS